VDLIECTIPQSSFQLSETVGASPPPAAGKQAGFNVWPKRSPEGMA
jgi:hypothetical protein